MPACLRTAVWAVEISGGLLLEPIYIYIGSSTAYSLQNLRFPGLLLQRCKSRLHPHLPPGLIVSLVPVCQASSHCPLGLSSQSQLPARALWAIWRTLHVMAVPHVRQAQR